MFFLVCCFPLYRLYIICPLSKSFFYSLIYSLLLVAKAIVCSSYIDVIYFILTEIFGQNRSHEKLIRKFLHLITDRETTFSYAGKVFHPIRNQLSKYISQFAMCSRLRASSVFIHRRFQSFQKFTQFSREFTDKGENLNRFIASAH